MATSPTKPAQPSRNRIWIAVIAVIAVIVVAVAVIIAIARLAGVEEPQEARAPTKLAEAAEPAPPPETFETTPEAVEIAAVAEPALDLAVLRAESDLFFDFAAGSLAGWNAQEGNAIMLTGTDGILAMVVRSWVTDPASSGLTGGAFVALPIDVTERFAGHSITVTVVAREARAQPAETFAVAYSTAEVGNSNWRRFDIGPEYATYSFDYDIPDHLPVTPDYLGVWADLDGSGRGVAVVAAAIRIKG